MNEAVDVRPTGRIESLLVALAFGLLAAGMVYLGARTWLPALASRHGAGIDRMLVYLLITTGALAVTGHLVLGWFVFRYTRGGAITHRVARRKTERTLSIIPGIVMTIVAEGGVLAIGMPVWSEYFASAPPADALAIEITAKQFEWHVRYPGPDGAFGRTDRTLIGPTNGIGLDESDAAAADDVLRVNRLYLPVDRPVRVRLRSLDVIHSFFLPQLRVKQDAVPGMAIDVWFVPTEEGRYELACTELCGLAHYYMKGLVDVLPEPEFQRWLEEAAEEG